MSSDQSFVDYVCEQAALGNALTYRKMFGEYALYLGDKVVALVCDNSLFLKPTDAGRTVVGKIVERPPYPGAKLHLLIDELVDEREALQRALRITADALPAPKIKAGARKAARGKTSGSAAKKKAKPKG
jgi:TfoX/Sxy family transcriptional regulator of competence genes